VAIMVVVCGHHGLWPSWFVAVIVEPDRKTSNKGAAEETVINLFQEQITENEC